MSVVFKNKITKYINELLKRKVIYVEEERTEQTLYRITDGYQMKYGQKHYITGIWVDSDDGETEFLTDCELDGEQLSTLMLTEGDLQRLQHIQVIVNLNLDGDEYIDLSLNSLDGRIKHIEKSLRNIADGNHVIIKLHDTRLGHIENTLLNMADSKALSYQTLDDRISEMETNLKGIAGRVEHAWTVLKSRYGY